MMLRVSKVKCCKLERQKDGTLKCVVHNDVNLRIRYFQASPEITYMIACATFHKEMKEESASFSGKDIKEKPR